MKEKIVKNLRQIAIGGFGILLLILFCLPYLPSTSGYEMIMILKNFGFVGFSVTFFQFLSIVGIAVMLDVVLLNVLRNFGVITINKSCKKLTLEKFAEIMLLVVAILTLIVLLFVIIFTANHGITIGLGSIFNAIMAVGAYVVYKVLDHYEYLDGIPNKPRVKKEKHPKAAAEAEVEVEVEAEVEAEDVPKEE